MVIKKTKKDKEKVCEIFEVTSGKNTKEKIVCGDLSNKHASKNEVNNFNKTLGAILIVILLLTGLFFAIYFISKSNARVEYKDTTFDKIKEGSITFYHTMIPSLVNGKDGTYNIYLRNNPKDLAKNVPLNNSIRWKTSIIINFSENYLDCNGDDTIAKLNFNQVFRDGMKLNIGKNDTFGCDSQGRYMYFELVQGNKTQIENFGPSCYKLEFTNCEVLPVTERVLIEAIAEYNKNSK